RFLPQLLDDAPTPTGQTVTLVQISVQVDVVSGSVTLVEPTQKAQWQVRQIGPVRLWDRIESALGAYDRAGRPTQESFWVRVDETAQWLEHPEMPSFELPQ